MIRFAFAELLMSLRRRRTPLSIALANITVVVFIILGLILVATSASVFLEEYRAASTIDVFLEPGTDPLEVTAAVLEISGTVRAEYFSEAESLRRFRELRSPVLADELDEALSGVVLPATLKVYLAGEIIQPAPIAADIAAVPGVDDVFFGRVSHFRLARLARIFDRAAGGLVFLAALLSILLIVNMVRVTVLTRRSDYRLLLLWGAPDRFILAPSLLEGGVLGMTGSLLGAAALLFVFWWVSGAVAWTAGHWPPSEQISGAILLSFLAGAIGGIIAACEILFSRKEANQ